MQRISGLMLQIYACLAHYSCEFYVLQHIDGNPQDKATVPTKSLRKTDKKYLFLCHRRLFYFFPVSPNPQSYFISEREVDICIFFRRLCNTRERSWTQPRLIFFSPKASVLPFPRWTNSAKQRSVLQCLYSGLLDFKTLITRENVTPAWGIFPKEQEGCPETRGKSYFIWS